MTPWAALKAQAVALIQALTLWHAIAIILIPLLAPRVVQSVKRYSRRRLRVKPAWYYLDALHLAILLGGSFYMLAQVHPTNEAVIGALLITGLAGSIVKGIFAGAAKHAPIVNEALSSGDETYVEDVTRMHTVMNYAVGTKIKKDRRAEGRET